MSNFLNSKKNGKKSVQFDPIFVKFAIYVRSKVNASAYKFMANVFNLPSDCTFSNYNTLDRRAKDVILHQTLR